jgi:hypothetical protein
VENRKILVENIDPFQPLSRYIHAEKVHELLTIPIDESRGQIGTRITHNIILFDYKPPSDFTPAAGATMENAY